MGNMSSEPSPQKTNFRTEWHLRALRALGPDHRQSAQHVSRLGPQIDRVAETVEGLGEDRVARASDQALTRFSGRKASLKLRLL